MSNEQLITTLGWIAGIAGTISAVGIIGIFKWVWDINSRVKVIEEKVNQHDKTDTKLTEDVEKLHSRVTTIGKDVAFIRGWIEGQDK